MSFLLADPSLEVSLMELRDVVGSIRKGQLTILEEVKNISQQMSSHFPLTQAGASNQLPEQPSQNLEQSGEPASQQFELSNQPSTIFN